MTKINFPISVFKPGYNSRKRFDLDKLMESIKMLGIINPLLVRAKGGNLEILSGHSRFMCAKKLNLKEIPAVVIEVDDKKAAHLSYIDNEQRTNLVTIDKADHMKYMNDKFKLSASDIAKEYSIGKSEVGRFWKIASLNEDAKVFLRRNDIGIFKAYEVTRLISFGDLVKIFETAYKKQKEEWEKEQEKEFETEVEYRQGIQMELVREIKERNMSYKDVQNSVELMLKTFKKRNDIIKMENEQQERKLFETIESELTNFNSNLRFVEESGKQFKDIFRRITSDFVDQIAEPIKLKIISEADRAINRIDKNINGLKETKLELLEFRTKLRKNNL